MKINKITPIRDGGSIELNTSEGIYIIDNRFESNTKGQLYLNYPNDNNDNLIDNQKELAEQLLEGLFHYNNSNGLFNSSFNPLVNVETQLKKLI